LTHHFPDDIILYSKGTQLWLKEHFSPIKNEEKRSTVSAREIKPKAEEEC